MKKEEKNSSLSNVMYMLNILWHGSRGYVLYTFIKEFTENVFWTIFSIYLTEWIYIAIENETPFAALASFVGAMCIGHICIHIMAAIHQLCEKQFLPKMYQDFQIYGATLAENIKMDFVNEDDEREKILTVLERADLGNKLETLSDSTALIRSLQKNFPTMGQCFRAANRKRWQSQECLCVM